MLNQYPLWKYLVIVFVAVIAVLFAMPNLYPDDPAIQISGATATTEVDLLAVDKAKTALQKANIEVKAFEQKGKSTMFRFNDTASQLKAKEVVQSALGKKFVVALNLAGNTPDWLVSIGATPMKLGLDLRGGVHFVLQVDMQKALKTRFDDFVSDIKLRLREEKLRYKTPFQRSDENGTINIEFRSAEALEKAHELLRKEFREFTVLKNENSDAFVLGLTITDEVKKEITDYAISQNLTSLRNRVNELGVAEPIVQRQGADRIVVQIPGIQDSAAAKRIIGRAANLEFRLVDWESDPMTTRRAPPDAEFIDFKAENRPVLLKKKVIVTGDRVINAQSNYDENGRPQVNIDLDSAGGKQMLKATSGHIKDSMAVVFIELKPEPHTVMENGVAVEKIKTIEERNVINVATIQAALGSSFRITGLDSPAEASELALLLRAGALAAPMYFVEERTIGPSLGAQNIESGFKSLLLGFALVMVFMLFNYRMFGLVANVALVMNLVLLFACMSMIPGATLTLPGMAGIVLTVGMAVDANVLIFSRIREELAGGSTPQQAIHAGYERAFVTILDANITTLLVALILFLFGSGPVKGFAVTLSIGILTSMFTAIFVSRGLINLLYGRRQLKTLKI
ncbi:MAG: protein translocase subunit SecD [Gammaproteobacteria bacterium]|nr:MAG: protein translocase subunit SecD [Gammaproteobacteria bacterium]